MQRRLAYQLGRATSENQRRPW